MTDDLLEAMARAIAAAEGNDLTEPFYECLREWQQDEFRAQARAALEAIREAGYVVVPADELSRLASKCLSLTKAPTYQSLSEHWLATADEALHAANVKAVAAQEDT